MRAQLRDGADRRDDAGVVAPPPFIYLCAWLIGGVLHAAVPVHLVARPSGWSRAIAAVCALAGVLLSASVVRTFAQAKTPVSPGRTTRALVQTGPYRFIRNPDYVGQALVYLAASITLNSLWPITLLPLAAVIVHYGVVKREERYLERKFGRAYVDYTARVRRWF